MNHLIAEDITRLAEAAAHRVINQAEAAAQRIEARAKAKDAVKESIRPDQSVTERVRTDLGTARAETGLPAFEGSPEMSGS